MAAARCAVCGQEEFLPFRCKLCSAPHCLDHRLPENHACPGLTDYRSRVREEREVRVREEVRVRGPSPLGSAWAGMTAFVRRSATHLLLAAMLLMFAVQVLGTIAVLALGATGRPDVAFEVVACSLALGSCPPFAGPAFGLLAKPWAIVTNIFAHAGVFHILFNALFLYFFGLELEQRIGRTRVLQMFFAAGLVAAVGQVAIFGGAVLGASGAVMGLLGTLTLLAPTMRVVFWFVPMPLWVMTLIFIGFDTIGVLQPGVGIANLAHLLGLALGVAYGLHLRRRGVLPRVQRTWASQRRW